MKLIFEDLLQKIRDCSPNFKSINLPDRGITDNNIKTIVDTILQSKNTIITDFYLADNSITNEGCAYLSKLQNIEYLDLESNQLSSKESLAQLLSNKSLEHIEITGNPIALEDIEKAAKKAQRVTIEFGEHRFNIAKEESQSLYRM